MAPNSAPNTGLAGTQKFVLLTPMKQSPSWVVIGIVSNASNINRSIGQTDDGIVHQRGQLELFDRNAVTALSLCQRTDLAALLIACQRLADQTTGVPTESFQIRVFLEQSEDHIDGTGDLATIVDRLKLQPTLDDDGNRDRVLHLYVESDIVESTAAPVRQVGGLSTRRAQR